jgi:hypothetical protein
VLGASRGLFLITHSTGPNGGHQFSAVFILPENIKNVNSELHNYESPVGPFQLHEFPISSS